MLEIRLPNGFRVKQVDNLNFDLIHSYISYGSGDRLSDEPKTVNDTIGHFRNVEEAVDRYVREIIKDGTDDFDGTMEEYIRRIENITSSAVKEMMKLVGGKKK